LFIADIQSCIVKELWLDSESREHNGEKIYCMSEMRVLTDSHTTMYTRPNNNSQSM
jgi:hypothetical protein